MTGLWCHLLQQHVHTRASHKVGRNNHMLHMPTKLISSLEPTVREENSQKLSSDHMCVTAHVCMATCVHIQNYFKSKKINVNG